MTGRLIRITTALAVIAVAVVAAVISLQHAFELVRSHGESGVTARLVPFTSGWADLGGVHGGPGCQPAEPAGTTAGGLEPRRWDRGHGWANLAHGVGHDPVGALVSASPALALVGSFELLMMLIRSRRGTRAGDAEARPRYQPAPREAGLGQGRVVTHSRTVRV
jgi:hypothetical protein